MHGLDVHGPNASGVSHNNPVNPDKHVQVNPPVAIELQVPCAHGLKEHGSPVVDTGVVVVVDVVVFADVFGVNELHRSLLQHSILTDLDCISLFVPISQYIAVAQPRV